jgi:hypothetical protein
VGWFSGFKLHRAVTDRGKRLAFCLTPGHVDDRRPVPHLVRHLFGKLVGERGDSSAELAGRLVLQQGMRLIAPLRKHRPPRLLDLPDHRLLHKRALIETIGDQRKNVGQIEHSRCRSLLNFLVPLMAGLIAYCHLPKTPHLVAEVRALSAA